MEVYQQVSIIHTGYCSGTRDTSFCPGAACCHWSILFEYNQWSFDTQGTSRLSGLWPINLPHYEKNNQWPWIMHFSSNRKDGQYINTSLFLRNAFFNNKLGSAGLCRRKNIPASCRNGMVPLLLRQLQMGEKIKMFFGVFFPFNLRNKAVTTKDFVSKEVFLPSDLKLNISLSLLVSKVRDTES